VRPNRRMKVFQRGPATSSDHSRTLRTASAARCHQLSSSASPAAAPTRWWEAAEEAGQGKQQHRRPRRAKKAASASSMPAADAPPRSVSIARPPGWCLVWGRETLLRRRQEGRDGWEFPGGSFLEGSCGGLVPYAGGGDFIGRWFRRGRGGVNGWRGSLTWAGSRGPGGLATFVRGPCAYFFSMQVPSGSCRS
jgi:hypothetical protein